MTAQEAAQELLREAGRPMSSRELAKQMLERRMVASTAQDPVFSFASTLEKNIRDGTYNRPALVFVVGPEGRLIALPDGKTKEEASSPVPPAKVQSRVQISLPADLVEDLKLATQAGLAHTLEESAAILLKRGLTAAASEIRSGIHKRLDSLGKSD